MGNFHWVRISYGSYRNWGIATVGGLTLGALDTFCLDKLISGWRPNQFIEDEVKKLLN